MGVGDRWVQSRDQGMGDHVIAEIMGILQQFTT